MKQYATSVYSQKSTTSAKSGRSFLSFTWSKKPTTTNTIEEDLNDIIKQSLWQSLKSWTTTTKSSEQRAKKTDQDSINTRSSSSSSSMTKLKSMFIKKSSSTTLHDSPRQSIDTLQEEEEEEQYTDKQMNPNGILINCHDNMEAIKERKKKRSQHILKLQHQNSKLIYHPCFKDKQPPPPLELESSSSDTLLEPVKKKKSVAFSNDDDEEQDLFNPRIMFLATSPVPRFRNVAPPPPPSPPYLDIIVHQDTDTHSIIKSPISDPDEPTIFITEDMDEHDRKMSLLCEQLKPRPRPKLYFYSPLQRGQTILFSLRNMIPEDHIILYKFLTTNKPDRYFVRPSAGKMTSEDQADIMLFLNQVPYERTPKDKIMIRWAAIQRHSVIEDWIHTLQESTRRKWIDMLDEQWPDQVTIRMTRIKIRFK